MIFHPIDQAGQVDQEIPLSEEALSVLRAFATVYHNLPHVPPWIGYLVSEDEQLVGACAFKTLPRHGRVEIAYYMFAAAQGRGCAARMVKHLIDVARREAPDIAVVAETRPEESGSTWLLRKLGFALVGAVQHPGDEGSVWQWRLDASPHEPRRVPAGHPLPLIIR